MAGEISCSSNTSSMGTFSENDMLTVTVIDADLDQVSTQPDRTGTGVNTDTLLPAVMFYGYNGDVETVTVTETDASSGIFTGVLPTTTNASNHVGNLLTYPAHLVSATYSDVLPYSLSECFLRFRSVGQVSVSSDNVLPLSIFTVTVTDADLNVDIYTSQTTEVAVKDGLGNTHAIMLKETGLDSAEFTAAIVITLNISAQNQGVQSATNPTSIFLRQVNDVLPISYNDKSPVGTRTAKNGVRVGERGRLQAQPQVVSSFASIIGAPGVNITVTDADLNTDANFVQQHAGRIKVSTLSGTTILSTIYVNLTENSKNSSVFTGYLRCVSASSVIDSERELGLKYLTGITASPILVQYADPTADTQLQFMTLQTERIGSIAITQRGSDTGRFGIGESITVIVQDKDLDVSNQADTCNVSVSSSGLSGAQADVEVLLLTETSKASGIFTALLETSSSGSLVANNAIVLPLSSGDVVTARYIDQFPRDFVASATITAGFIGFISTYPAQLLSNTATVTITLTDYDLNVAAGTADFYAKELEYLWYTFDGSPKVYLELTETSADSSQFTSILSLPSGGSARPPGSYFTIVYMDPDIGGKGAVRNAFYTNPSTKVISFGANGADNVGGFSLSSAGEMWRSSDCPSYLIWAASCGPTPACSDEHLCGPTMSSLDIAGDYRLAAGSALTVTVKDRDQNRDTIAAESVLVRVRVEQSADSLAANGAAQNPYCAIARDECYRGSSNLAACNNDGDCPGGSCIKRGCFQPVRRKEEQPILNIMLTETGANTGSFSGIIYTRDSPQINNANNMVVHVGVGDTMSITYADSPSLTSLTGENRSRYVKILKAGRPARLSCPSKLLAGGKMEIMLTDPDLVGATTASIQVRVIASNGRLSSEQETLQMRARFSNNAKGKLWGVLQVQIIPQFFLVLWGVLHYQMITEHFRVSFCNHADHCISILSIYCSKNKNRYSFIRIPANLFIFLWLFLKNLSDGFRRYKKHSRDMRKCLILHVG